VIGQAITFYPNFGFEVLQYTITTKFEQNIMICKGLNRILTRENFCKFVAFYDKIWFCKNLIWLAKYEAKH